MEIMDDLKVMMSRYERPAFESNSFSKKVASFSSPLICRVVTDCTWSTRKSANRKFVYCNLVTAVFAA